MHALDRAWSELNHAEAKINSAQAFLRGIDQHELREQAGVERLVRVSESLVARDGVFDLADLRRALLDLRELDTEVQG